MKQYKAPVPLKKALATGKPLKKAEKELVKSPVKTPASKR